MLAAENPSKTENSVEIRVWKAGAAVIDVVKGAPMSEIRQGSFGSFVRLKHVTIGK
jgi:hypothetical protein